MGDETMKKLSLAEKIGQLVMAGIEGTTLGNDARSLLREYHVGGIILFARNIADPEQARNLVKSLKLTNSCNKVPLFVSMDEEGGRVSRMPDQFVKLPTNRAMGDTGDITLAKQMGAILGQRVRALGCNLNYAPVLDINSNPANPVIGDRSLGVEPEVVTKMGVQIMVGMQSAGVIPVIKHFPGHGDTSVDSHVGLPRVEADLDRLKSFELIPFGQAIREGADMVMTAHILMPKIDDQHPATLSRAILTGVLREQLNFGKVVITDDLTMAAIKDNYDLGEAAVLALNAGADMVMVCHHHANIVKVITSLRRAVEDGSLPEVRLNTAVSRILALKQRYHLQDIEIEPMDIDVLNRQARTLLAKV